MKGINNKIIAVLFFISISLISCIGPKSNVSSIEKVEKLENALLWKIEGNNLEKPSYLFGTIHLIKAEKYFLPAGFENAFDKCSSIIFEIDIAKMNDVSEQMKILPKILMKGDTSLKDLITDVEYKKVQEFFKKKNLPLFLFEKVKPMFLTMFTDGDFDPSSIQNGDYVSYEMEISKMVQEKHKNTGGLETMDFQVGILDSIPYKYQADMLMKSINADSQESSQMDEMYKLYLEQNISALHQSIELDDISKYDKILLNNRNSNWISKMKSYMKKEPTLFAVGAGHLGGNKGVINLLRKEGFLVSAVLE